MSTTIQKNVNSLATIKSFTYPKLITGKEWYVLFYAYDPSRDSIRRKRIKLNHIEKIGERRKYADGLMKRLINKLESGWNPWIEAENEKAYRPFADTCEHYRKHITKLLNDGLLREDTYRSYMSQLKNIQQWNESKKMPITYIYQFDRSFITEFLEEIYIGRKNSAQTRNNYLTFIRIFCSFLLEYQYVKAKPSDGVTSLSKRKMKKIRTTISERDIHRLHDYLSENNKHYLLACYILHYCFVRRKEMSLLKISDISVNRQTLFIRSDISKNGKGATITLPERVIRLMLDLGVLNNPGHYFLFADQFRPGAKHKHEKQFTDYWAYHIRKDLHFPDSYQFYSLKDTGITDMLKQYDVVTVRDQARHSNIQMTDKYTPHDTHRANEQIKKYEGLL